MRPGDPGSSCRSGGERTFSAGAKRLAKIWKSCHSRAPLEGRGLDLAQRLGVPHKRRECAGNCLCDVPADSRKRTPVCAASGQSEPDWASLHRVQTGTIGGFLRQPPGRNGPERNLGPAPRQRITVSISGLDRVRFTNDRSDLLCAEPCVRALLSQVAAPCCWRPWGTSLAAPRPLSGCPRRA